MQNLSSWSVLVSCIRSQRRQSPKMSSLWESTNIVIRQVCPSLFPSFFFFFFFFLHMALTLIRLSFYLSNIKGQIHSFSNLSRRAARCGKKKNYNCNMIIFAKRKCPLRSGEEKYLARASLQRYRTLVWCRLSHILLICYRKNVTFWWINGPTLIFLLL